MSDGHATYTFTIAPVDPGRPLSTAPSPEFMYLFSQQLDAMPTYQDQIEAVVSMVQLANNWLAAALPEADPVDVMRRCAGQSIVGTAEQIEATNKAIEESGGKVVRFPAKETAH